MGFIQRGNLEAIPFIENILNIQIHNITVKIGAPIIIHNSLNNLTKYKGNDILEIKKMKSRNDKLKHFLKIIKRIYKAKKEAESKDKNMIILKVILLKSNRIYFMCKKSK
jgi:hypothetical protein